MDIRKRDIFYYLCRAVVGITFIVSAVLKFVSLSSFELYVYSSGFFDMAMSSFLAHSLIGIEMFLGTMLLANVFNRLIDWAVWALLLFFSLLTIYMYLIGVDGNCHCFGEAIEFTPLQSLGKNVVLALLFWFGTKSKEFVFKMRPLLLLLLAVWAAIFSFVLKQPYSFRSVGETRYNAEFFADFLESEDGRALNVGEGKQVLVLFSPSCGHCRVAVKRLDIFLSKRKYPVEGIRWIVKEEEAEKMDDFLSYTGLTMRETHYVEASDLANITRGRVPLIILLKDGEVVGKMSNSTYREEKMDEFLRSE